MVKITPSSTSVRPASGLDSFETLLVFVFVYEGEYGALAIIIGTKEFVRKEQIQKNPTYFLLGTLVNVSVALVFALTARNLLTR